MLKRSFVCLLTVAAISLVSRDAAASEFSFGCISNNSATNCSVLESQLSVTITLNATNSSLVDFLFKNAGPAASSITDIYFDDPPPLLGTPGYISGSSGVSFAAGCSPGNLPGGNPYGFTTAYCADSNSPTQPNGVNPTEWLRLSYTLQGSYTLDDVLKAIAADSFQVGIHVQGFANGGSEAAILRTTTVPEPGTLVLLGIGAAATLVRRRQKIA